MVKSQLWQSQKCTVQNLLQERLAARSIKWADSRHLLYLLDLLYLVGWGQGHSECSQPVTEPTRILELSHPCSTRDYSNVIFVLALLFVMVETFSELHCGLRLFLPNVPLFSSLRSVKSALQSSSSPYLFSTPCSSSSLSYTGIASSNSFVNPILCWCLLREGPQMILWLKLHG